jgi:hypothetical protein
MEGVKRGFPEGGTKQHARHVGSGGELAEDAKGVRTSSGVMVAATVSGRSGHGIFHFNYVVCDREFEASRTPGDRRIDRRGDGATGGRAV